MTRDPVAARYAEAFVDFLEAGGRAEPGLAALESLAALIREHRELAQFLVNPDVEAPDKVQLIGRLLARPGEDSDPQAGGSAWSEDVRACVEVAMGRADVLPEIIQAARELLEAKQRILRVRVRSAHPLSEPLRSALVRGLETRERCKVRLTEDVDAQLIGGIQVYLNHRVLDGSVASQLRALRQRLKSVRVH